MADRDLSALRIDPAARQEPSRRWLAPSIISGLVVLAAAAWWLSTRPTTFEVRTARATAAGSQGPASVLNASGYVTPRRRATVSSKITGKLVEVRIEEGVTVEQEEVLARLDSVDALAALRASQAELAVARASRAELEVELTDALRSLERTRELEAQGVSSIDELDRAETRVAAAETALARAATEIGAAKARVEVAARDVDSCVIRAPFAGVVVSKDAQPGEMVSPVSAGGGYTRTGIATIVDMGSLEIEVDVNEAYIARVKPGQRVDAVLDAYPDWHIAASVITVIPTADRQKATVQVRIGLDELDPRILPDMGVRVSFLDAATGDRADSQQASPTIRAPIAAVSGRQADGDTAVVFVVEGQKAARQAVRLGRELEGEIEIVSGLRAGQTVILDPPPELVDGAAIRVSPQQDAP